MINITRLFKFKSSIVEPIYGNNTLFVFMSWRNIKRNQIIFAGRTTGFSCRNNVFSAPKKYVKEIITMIFIPITKLNNNPIM